MTTTVVRGPLEPLEVAAGIVLEPATSPPLPPLDGKRKSARQALEDVVLSHLLKGRGSVSFSGGRDSSLILAIACHVARREGLPDPVPITARHRSAESDESDYQELVIGRLGITDWVKVDDGDTMDLLAPEATAILEVTGVQAPPNAYLHLPMIEVAPPGVLMTGAGGDEVLGSTAGRVARVLYRRARPRPRDVVRVGYALAPGWIRRRRAARTPFHWSPWLTPAAERAVRERRAAETARNRVRWDTDIRRLARSRTQRLGLATLERIGSLYGVSVASPLADPAFVDAFARDMGAIGPPSRTQAMYHLAADLLPKALLERSTKAIFDAVVWGPRFREFAEGWDPADLPAELADLVDAERLASAWREAGPPYTAMMLAQHAWLSARRSRGDVLDR